MGKDSVDSTAIAYTLYCPGIESPRGQDTPHSSRRAAGPTQPPTQWVPGRSPGVKCPGRGVDHPLPSSAEVKERVRLQLYSPSVPSWQEWTLPLATQYTKDLHFQTKQFLQVHVFTTLAKTDRKSPGSKQATNNSKCFLYLTLYRLRYNIFGLAC